MLNSQGMKLLKQLFSSKSHIYKMDEIIIEATKLKIRRPQLRRILSSLTKQGWLSRIRRGLYVAHDPIADQIRIHPFTIATHLVESAFISHWSAAHYHALTEQIPHTITASTTKKIITPSMYKASEQPLKSKHMFTIEGINYEYFTIKKSQIYGIEKIWLDEYSEIEMTDKERTLLDMFIYPKSFGGISESFGMLHESLGQIDLEKLIEYAIRCKKKAVIKRLGWILDSFDVSEKILEPLLKSPIQYYCRLDPSKSAKGACDSKWMIQNNLIEE